MSELHLKAEMWDKMQFLFRNYYDRMVHAVLKYDGLIDVDALKYVLLCFTELQPVLHSSFVYNAIRPYWSIEDYTIDDILTVKEAEDYDSELEDFITYQIPVDSNVQFRVLILNRDGKSTFAMIVNHMCFDGGDFKYFLKKMAENYNNYLTNGVSPLDIKTGSRSYDAVYTNMNRSEERVARKLYKNISAVKDKHVFPLSAADINDKCMIVRRKIDKDLFAAFRAAGKKDGYTVNDLMLGVFIHALFKVGDYPKEDTLTIPCMVDLRRHIKGGENAGGLTNHTGFMQCSVSGRDDTVAATLVKVVESVQKSKDDKYMGLYSLPLLKLAYGIFPHAISEQAIKIGYINPLIGMSNIGYLPADKLTLGDMSPVDGFMTGAIKFKPYVQLALTTLNGVMTMSMAIKGNSEDRATVERFFDLIIDGVKEYAQA